MGLDVMKSFAFFHLDGFLEGGDVFILFDFDRKACI
jgi:hypothetical protein